MGPYYRQGVITFADCASTQVNPTLMSARTPFLISLSKISAEFSVTFDEVILTY